MIRVKVFKYKKGKIISIGVDPLEPYDLPVAIFYNKNVIDPIMYAITEEKIPGAENAIYVRDGEAERVINEIINFYKKYGNYIGMDIKVKIIEVENFSPGTVTIEKKATAKQPPARKINVLEELGITTKEKPKTVEIAQVNEIEIPEV